MARVKRGVTSKQRKKPFFKAAKGYSGGRRVLWRTVRNAVERARTYAYRDRRVKKRDFRRLWIVRINAACREHGLSYSQLIYGLHKNNINLDRKVLANMAINDAAGFQLICKQSQA